MTRAFLPHIITDDSALGGSVIERSLIFNSSDSTQLENTSLGTSPTSRRICTISVWFQRNEVDEESGLLTHGYSGSGGSASGAPFRFVDSGTRLSIMNDTNNSTDWKVTPSRLLRDSTAWYHLVVAIDTTQGTASNRVKIYYNGVQETDFETANYPSQNFDNLYNYEKVRLGAWDGNGYYNGYNGYIAEYNSIDGQQLDASYFGFFDSQTGIWLPKKYEGTYGTNGHYLDFSDNSSTATLGIDKSPNGKDFTASNLSVTSGESDSTTYAPTNKLPTFHPLYSALQGGGSVTYSEGNLKIATSASGSNYNRYPFAMSSPEFAVNSGKWYAEFKCNSTKCAFGVCNTGQLDSDMTNNPYGAAARTSIIYTSEGQLRGNNSDIRNGNGAFTTNDIIGIALDLDNMKIYFHKNGTYINSGNPNTGANPDTVQDLQYNNSGGYVFQAGSDGQNSVTLTANFGQRAFSYSVPTGYKTLTRDRLPDNTPSIIRPQRHFECLTYTGNGGTQTISGLEFSPGLVWIKSRSSAINYQLIDTVRGATKRLQSNQTTEEKTNTNGLTAFTEDGFTVGDQANVNGSGLSLVAWCWKAGGSSNTYNIDGTGYATAAAAGLDGGTIDPTGASINTKNGFSIVTYTANGTAGATIAHGLGKKPAWIIIKCRSNADNWMVNHQQMNEGSSPEDHYSELNFHGGATDSPNMLNDTAPTDTLVTINNDGAVNSGSRTYVMYCWAEVPGYSKFGYYRATGVDTDGPYVHLGFRPAWVMIKSMSLSNSDWMIFDNKRNTSNPVNIHLAANQTHVDGSDNYEVVDFLAHGFKVTGLSGSGINYNTSYPHLIYMAFAEQQGQTPFNTFPNAR